MIPIQQPHHSILHKEVFKLMLTTIISVGLYNRSLRVILIDDHVLDKKARYQILRFKCQVSRCHLCKVKIRYGKELTYGVHCVLGERR